MAMPGRSTVVGVFTERGVADRAIEELQGAGFRADQIKFEQQESSQGSIATPSGTPTGVGPATGTPGPIDTTDDSTRQGGLIGSIKRLFTRRKDEGIVDDLQAMGVPEEDARYYQSEFELGRTIVAVEAGDRREDALAILRSDGAYDATTRRGTSDRNVPSGTSDPNAQAGTYDANTQAGTYNPNVPSGTYDPNAQAGTTTSNAQAGTYDPNASRGTYDPNAQAGTTTPDTQAGTYTSNAQAGTYDPNAPSGTYDPNASRGTNDSMTRPETYDTQPRQTGTWDDRNA